MKGWRAYSPVALLALGMTSGSGGLASEGQIERPDFTMEVQLDERARQYLMAHQESVVMSVNFADYNGPGGISLAYIRHEANDSFSVGVKDVPFDLRQRDRLRTMDYEVLVNVSSGRRKLDSNVLDCEFLQAPISKLQRHVNKIQCRLGDWAPRVKPKR